MEKTLIIMTMSAKINGFCVAGIDVNNGAWVRLISDNNEDGEGAVLRQDLLYEDGSEAQIFDVIKVCGNENPTNAQRENFIYDSNYYWTKVGISSLQEVVSNFGCDDNSFIFENTSKSLEEDEITGESLLLVEIDEITISVCNDYGKTKHKISFTYNNTYYHDISLSDIELKNEFNTLGTHNLKGRHYAVFSITGKYERTGKYYKMLAKLF